MPAGPQITFTQFDSAGSSKLVPWRDHVARVAGSAPVAAVATARDTSVVVWQVASGNNRSLGRGARLFPSLEDAASDARRLADGADFVKVNRVGDPSRGRYGWFFSVDDVVVMVCSRWYGTERDCRYAIALALAAMPTATINGEVRRIHPSLMASARLDNAR